MQVSAATVDSARAVVAAHSSWSTWALIGVVALEAIVIVSLMRHHGGWDFLATLPTTNLRITVGIALFAFANVGLIVSGYVTKVWPPVDVILAIEGALLLNMGLDVTQYGVKRHTEDPEVIAANAAANCPPAPPIAPVSTDPASTNPPNIDPAPVPPVAPSPPVPAPTAARVAPPAHVYEPGN